MFRVRDGDVWSSMTIELVPDERGTRLVLTQSGVPEAYAAEIPAGWDHSYWQPMTKYFKEREGE